MPSPQLTARDLRIIALLGGFHFMTTSHVRALVFADNSSNTPAERSMARLKLAGMVKPVARRSFGTVVPTRGVTPVVYALTTKGYRTLGVTERVTTRKGITYIEHCLSVVDVVCDLKRQEADGALRVVHFMTEPDTHTRIGGEYLRPDLTLRVEVPHIGKARSIWLEVDQATQSDRVILAKLRRYIKAYDSTNEDDPWYLVVFATPDQDRADAIKWLIRSHARKYVPLFEAVTVANFTAIFDTGSIAH